MPRIGKPKPTPAELGLKLIKRCHDFKHPLYLKTAVELVNQGADVAIADQHGNTALMGCASHKGDAYFEFAKILIAKGALLDAQTALGTTALHWGISHGNTDVILLLIDAGCNVHLRNGDLNGKMTPLHTASETVQPDVVRALLDAGADINARDKFGYTPMHRMATSARDSERTIETAKVLLSAEPDCNMTDNWGRTALDRLAKSGGTGEGMRHPEIHAMVDAYMKGHVTKKRDRILQGAIATAMPVKSKRLAFKGRKP